MEHTPFMTTQMTDVELRMLSYHAGGLVCCGQDPPPTIALFVA